MRNSEARLLRHFLSILLWTIGALILIDAVVGLAFRAPADPARATSLQRYFENGRSIEGKLRRYVGSSPDQDALIVTAGWLSDCDAPTLARPGKLAFDTYGMSFSKEIANRLEALDPGLAGQSFLGPAAPLNHSYACFIRRVRLGLARAPIQILGVLASSIPRMETLSGLTTSFDVPQPFTYPRYFLGSDGRLVARWSSIKSREDLRAALSDTTKWRIFLDELAANDEFYVEELVKADIFDHSVLARMLRRAWALRSVRMRTAALRPADFAPDIAAVLVKILLDFAATARAAGQHPIVILFENKDYGTALSATAAPVLIANRIDFVATSTISSPTDPSNFLKDGHFTAAVNDKIAHAVLNLLNHAR